MRNDVGMCTFKSHVICYTIQDLQSNKTKSVIFQTNCRCLHTGGWFLKYYINLASKHEIDVEPKATAALCFPSNNLYFMQACQDVFLQKAYNDYYCIWLQQLNFSWQKKKKKKNNWKFAGEGFLWRLQRCFQTESLAWPQQPVLTPPFIIVTIKSKDLCRAASWFNDKHSLQTTWLKVLFTDEGKGC